MCGAPPGRLARSLRAPWTCTSMTTWASMCAPVAIALPSETLPAAHLAYGDCQCEERKALRVKLLECILHLQISLASLTGSASCVAHSTLLKPTEECLVDHLAKSCMSVKQRLVHAGDCL